MGDLYVRDLGRGRGRERGREHGEEDPLMGALTNRIYRRVLITFLKWECQDL